MFGNEFKSIDKLFGDAKVRDWDIDEFYVAILSLTGARVTPKRMVLYPHAVQIARIDLNRALVWRNMIRDCRITESRKEPFDETEVEKVFYIIREKILPYIENNILSQAGNYIRKMYHGKRIMIISDDNVFPLYGDTLIRTLDSDYECHHLVLPHGEATKDFQTLPTVYKAMLEAKISRSDLVIALGGGVIGDLAGFAASSYLRGVRLVQIPTSLLAQVDSSVGGKVAVDLPEGKNLVGAFYQPSLVLIDPLVLNTLKERFINDGMGEVIKYGCIKNADLWMEINAKEIAEQNQSKE